MLFAIALCANSYDFSVYKKGSGTGNTVLIIGGIQGDEPGGFSAASLLATKYAITHGNIWVVPNLNFESIIKRSRGVHGDMNRKFRALNESDPEFELVEKVKDLITHDEVDLVINLHDGSGFYRKQWIDKKRNPYKWGQCTIIDQKKLEGVKFGNLREISEFVVANVNERSLKSEHNYLVKNTKTYAGNEEMAKSLTWFAVQNGKPAFGNEASKEFLTPQRAFYHLLAVEAFLEYAGVAFERDFALDPKGVELALNDDVKININDKIVLDVINSKNWINYLPLKKGAKQKIVSNNPLATIVPQDNHYRVHYGNRRMSILMPQYFDYDEAIDGFDFLIDGESQKIPFGEVVEVSRDFLVAPKEGYRTNVIGFTQRGVTDESGFVVSKKDILNRFAIDKEEHIFRVEIYNQKENRFAGMVLVRFTDTKGSDRLTSLELD